MDVRVSGAKIVLLKPHMDYVLIEKMINWLSYGLLSDLIFNLKFCYKFTLKYLAVHCKDKLMGTVVVYSYICVVPTLKINCKMIVCTKINK